MSEWRVEVNETYNPRDKWSFRYVVGVKVDAPLNYWLPWAGFNTSENAEQEVKRLEGL